MSEDREKANRREGIKRLDYRHLQVFEAVYATRNITRAGRLLGLTQPTMSNLLARLRDVLQDPLFVRQPRGVEPTSRADELIETVRSALEAFDEITDPSPRFDPQNAVREFRIHMVDMFEAVIMPPLIEAALSSGGITFKLILAAKAPIAEALESGEADLAIGLPPPHHMDLRWEDLTPADLLLIARKGHPVVRPPLDLKVLETVGHVSLDMTPKAMANTQNLVMAKRFERRDVVRVSRISSVLELVANSDLIGFANRLHIAASPYRDQLQALEAPNPFNNQMFQMIWHTRAAEDEGVIWLRAQIQKAIATATAASTSS